MQYEDIQSWTMLTASHSYVWVKDAICDVNKQNQSELRNIDFKIEPNKAKNVFCFLLILASFNCSYLWNQLTNFNEVFCKIWLWKWCIQLKRKLWTGFGWLQTDFAWSYHIRGYTELDNAHCFSQFCIG